MLIVIALIIYFQRIAMGIIAMYTAAIIGAIQ